MSGELSNYISFLSKSPFFIVITSIISIIGVIMSIFFYLKGKRIKKPKIAIRSVNLLRDSAEKINGLKILYLSNPISNVSITKLAIWNDGKETINGTDIAPADPLTIEAKDDYKILEYKIIYAKNNSNQIKLVTLESGKKISVVFDYLDYEEGAVIQVLHTGNSSNDIKFSGTVKGVGKIYTKTHNGKLEPILKKIKLNGIIDKKILGIIIVLIGIFMPISVFFVPNDNITTFNEKVIADVVSLIMGIIYDFFGYYFFLKKQIPKGFEIFEEKI